VPKEKSSKIQAKVYSLNWKRTKSILNPIFNEFVLKPESMTKCTARHLLKFGGGGQLSIWNMQTLSLAFFLLSILLVHRVKWLVTFYVKKLTTSYRESNTFSINSKRVIDTTH